MNVKHTLGIIYTDLDYRNTTVLWSDGQAHNHYFFNEPTSTPPSSNLTVTDWPHFRQLVDKWVAKGGNSVAMPILWDWTQYGENNFEFRPYLWALQYAQTKGITIGFWMLPFRRYTEAQYPTFNTTTSWSFLPEDREIDSFGAIWGDAFNHCLALGSSKWANVFRWIDKAAEAIQPYSAQIEYLTIGTNPTYETSFQMERVNANHPDTVAKWIDWHQMTYGTTPSSMATTDVQEGLSVNKTRTAKFLSTIYKELNDTALAIVKNRLPSTRYIWHGGSMTDVTFLRGAFTNMATLSSVYDGVKHNPNGGWDAKFETRAIAKEGKYAVVEWTRDSGLPTPQIFAQKIMESIDAGASGISYSFFDSLYQDSSVESFTDSVIAILSQNGYWNTQTRSLTNGNTDVINFKTSDVIATAGNKFLDYRTVYTAAFDASKASHSGNPPTIIWTDDVELGRSKTATPTISLYNTNGITIGTGNSSRTIEIYRNDILAETLTNQAGTSINKAPLVNARYKVRSRDSDKVWSDFSNQVVVTGATLPTCDPSGRSFSLVSVSYNAQNRNLNYVYDAENCVTATWAIKQGSTVVQSGSVSHSSSNITITLGSQLADGNYTFELTGTSCQGTATLGFTVSGSSYATSTVYVSCRFDDACSGGKICQFGYSTSQAIEPSIWSDATSVKRLQVIGGVVTEVSTGGNLYQTKAYELVAGTYYFFAREKNNNTNLIYLGIKVVS